ncbi:unnamed protein product [Darwinula stevensoni]|uniref:Small integral membrane protein 8 n=1 Tax=Darwinula stevensoni TaxID=69355 RepID=A0A7R9A867_9CRUS|nr:unnamed protein product [Darwinula stevensoni]CAG0895896.1 unnamed protein product [Darwinula stevensoni]
MSLQPKPLESLACSNVTYALLPKKPGLQHAYPSHFGNKVVMILGLIGISGALGYLVWLRSYYNNQGFYIAVAEDGSHILQPKKSKWD